TQFRTPVVLNAINPTRMIIGGGNDPYQSTNSGTSVVELTDGGAGVLGGVNESGPIAYGGKRLGVANLNVLYVGSGDNVFVRTGGGTVLTLSASYPGSGSGEDVMDVVLDPNDWMKAYVIDTDHVYATANAGATWADITGDLITNGLQTIVFVP